jgi:hypothetical protein
VLGGGLGGGCGLALRPGAAARAELLLLGLLLARHLLPQGVLALGELELLGEVRVAVDVAHVEEGGLLEPDVDEGGLHAGEHADHAPLVDVADDALLALALEVELVDGAALDQRHARLRAGGVDHQDAGASHVGPRLPGHPSPGARGARSAVDRDGRDPGGAGLVPSAGEPVLLSIAFPCARRPLCGRPAAGVSNPQASM